MHFFFSLVNGTDKASKDADGILANHFIGLNKEALQWG
jgi:hypothetical protein